MQLGGTSLRPRKRGQSTSPKVELQLNKELDTFVASYHRVFIKENEDDGKIIIHVCLCINI